LNKRPRGLPKRYLTESRRIARLLNTPSEGQNSLGIPLFSKTSSGYAVGPSGRIDIPLRLQLEQKKKICNLIRHITLFVHSMILGAWPQPVGEVKLSAETRAESDLIGRRLFWRSE
jgi:hypothetical protein